MWRALSLARECAPSRKLTVQSGRMRVLLTGATGFVGSHMLARLVADGHQIRAVVRNPEKLKSPDGPGHVEAIVGDVVTGAGLSQAAPGCEAGQ